MTGTGGRIPTGRPTEHATEAKATAEANEATAASNRSDTTHADFAQSVQEPGHGSIRASTPRVGIRDVRRDVPTDGECPAPRRVVSVRQVSVSRTSVGGMSVGSWTRSDRRVGVYGIWVVRRSGGRFEAAPRRGGRVEADRVECGNASMAVAADVRSGRTLSERTASRASPGARAAQFRCIARPRGPAVGRTVGRTCRAFASIPASIPGWILGWRTDAASSQERLGRTCPTGTSVGARPRRSSAVREFRLATCRSARVPVGEGHERRR